MFWICSKSDHFVFRSKHRPAFTQLHALQPTLANSSCAQVVGTITDLANKHVESSVTRCAFRVAKLVLESVDTVKRCWTLEQKVGFFLF